MSTNTNDDTGERFLDAYKAKHGEHAAADAEPRNKVRDQQDALLECRIALAEIMRLASRGLVGIDIPNRMEAIYEQANVAHARTQLFDLKPQADRIRALDDVLEEVLDFYVIVSEEEHASVAERELLAKVDAARKGAR